MAPDHDQEKGHRIFIIITHVSPRFPINSRWPYLSPCAGSHIEARRVRPIGRRSRSGHWNQTKRVAPPQAQGGMAQTSRDSPAAVIPQAVTPRTRRAGRSGTHKAHARVGTGAGEPPHSLCASRQKMLRAGDSLPDTYLSERRLRSFQNRESPEAVRKGSPESGSGVAA